MKKKVKFSIIVLIILLLSFILILFISKDNSELKTIKSKKELSKIYEGDDYSEFQEFIIRISTMPFSLFSHGFYLDVSNSSIPSGVLESQSIDISTSQQPTGNISIPTADKIQGTASSSNSSSKDYSTTNIQVENVDEADITKTDGNYIYSISDNTVVITDISNPNDIKIASTINSSSDGIPVDLILNDNKLVVISSISYKAYSSYYSYNSSNTLVNIYDISDRNTPKILKSYELYEPYYTSRCIDNKLYVISSGTLREQNDDVITYYIEDNSFKDIGLNNIKYLKDIETNQQTIFSFVDLNNPTSNIKVSSYLLDISNAYVSENSIYLLNSDYENSSYQIKSLFGLKGIPGFFENQNYYDYDYYTDIYKFDITKDGNISYNTKTNIKGETINQYSLDEYNNHLRIALSGDDGSRIVIFDENLNQIGESDYVAQGEKMYSSRFIGDKVYLVTYKNMDPLFVIDLSNEKHPKVMGQLKIPGYSTYLHPYDENHLIGIGMETKEIVRKDINGRVTSSTSQIVGMKMALFDISDVNNPKEISNTVIGDSRTTSAILTNPKALLFSKEKGIIAIPVNNYNKDFEISNSSNSNESIISSYRNYKGNIISEGYIVYNINVESGFTYKGLITHEISDNNKSYYYSNYSNSKLLRGLYVDDDLYTVSESAIKVNKLDSLDLLDELNLKEEIKLFENTTISNDYPNNTNTNMQNSNNEKSNTTNSNTTTNEFFKNIISNITTNTNFNLNNIV